MPQSNKQKQSEKPSESSPDQQQKVKTLFVSGLPSNVREREIYLLFRGCKGYEGCVLNTTGKQPVCFVVFKSHKAALKAMEQLQGVQFDPHNETPIRIELAKNNTKTIQKRARTQSNFEEELMEKRIKYMQPQDTFALTTFANHYYPQAYFENYVAPTWDPRFTFSLTKSLIHVYEQDANMFDSMSPYMSRQEGFFNPYTFGPYYPTSPSNITGQNSPCNTLFIANLSNGVKEEDIRAVVSKCHGFRRIKMHNTGKDPVCFAEFYDVNCAAQAMLQLQGITLKGYDRPIRVEFAKAEMGRKSVSPCRSPLRRKNENTPTKHEK